MSVNLPYAHKWNTVVTSGLVPGPSLADSLEPWLIVEMWPA